MAIAYRWNTSDFAVGYDAAAEKIHPHYVAIQDVILDRLALVVADQPAVVVDLGGGSGRLMERILDRWPTAIGVIVDQSEPFLAIAERKLSRFVERAILVKRRLQDDWAHNLPRAASAIVSMSAIHHLEPTEKQHLFRRCCDSLEPAGMFLNGDEVRPADDAAYLRVLSDWASHMRRGMASGAVPPVFHDALNGWIDRNVTRFGEPKHSGDDCHETIETQLRYLLSVGFERAECVWQRDLWAVMEAVKFG